MNFGNFGKMAGMMQKINKIKKELQDLDQTFSAETFKGQAGGGLVEVTINGKIEIVGIDIDNSLFTGEDKSMIGDLIAAAFNNAKQQAEQQKQDKIKNITGGLSLPPGLGF